MKKKLRIPLLFAAVCLAALAVAIALHLTFDRLALSQIHRTSSANTPPAPARRTFSYATVGAYPGLSDEPVSWEEGQSGRDFYALLGEHTYARIFLLHPRQGGTAVSTATGCAPEYVAYWDGRFLWFPVIRREKLVWEGYLPSSPRQFDESLNALCNK